MKSEKGEQVTENAENLLNAIEDLLGIDLSSKSLCSETFENLLASNLDFKEYIAVWALYFSIKQEALECLVKILLKKFKEDDTHKPNEANEVKYHHFGVEKQIQTALKNFPLSSNQIEINCNLNLACSYGNSVQKIWPILGSFVERPKIPPFIIGIHIGSENPIESKNNLKAFVEEISEINETGGVMNIGKTCKRVKVNHSNCMRNGFEEDSCNFCSRLDVPRDFCKVDTFDEAMVENDFLTDRMEEDGEENELFDNYQAFEIDYAFEKSPEKKPKLKKRRHDPNEKIEGKLCDLCGQYFDMITRKSFQEHYGNHLRYLKYKERRYCCDRCGTIYLTKKGIISHLSSNCSLAQYRCQICENRTFKFLRSYNVHLLSHNQDKPFKCDYEGCSRQFIRKEDFKLHQATHSDLRPFKCMQCDKSYKRRMDLREHQATVHKELFEINCEICNKPMRSKKLLRSHMRSHSGRKFPGFQNFLGQ